MNGYNYVDPLEFGIGAASVQDIPRLSAYAGQVASISPQAAARAAEVIGQIQGAQSVLGGISSPAPNFPNVPGAVVTPSAGVEDVKLASAGGLLALLPGLLSKIPALAKLAGLVGGGVAIGQALGLGEGGGIGGLNLFGGDNFTLGGVQFGGPGLPEPPANQVVKEWRANNSQFYLLTNGKIAVYSRTKRRWKVYRPQKLAVIGKKMPSHRMVTRLRRNLKKQTADARTILQITSPNSLKKKRYHYARRR